MVAWIQSNIVYSFDVMVVAMVNPVITQKANNMKWTIVMGLLSKSEEEFTLR